MQALEKYTRNQDQRILVALWEEFGNGVIQKVPYADPAGLKFVLDEVSVRRPEAKKINVAELVDNRFVKGLEESGFVKTLYDGKWGIEGQNLPPTIKVSVASTPKKTLDIARQKGIMDFRARTALLLTR